MGVTNAQQLLDEQELAWQSATKSQEAQQALSQALDLDPAAIHRIETYDISNIQGHLATAAMVVFIDGQAATNQYRKFRIRLPAVPNDFAMLQETIRRRFANRNRDWPQPDLIIIDGGKGQLSAVQKTLRQLDVIVPAIAIAKREEEIFMPAAGKFRSVRLPYNSAGLFLIQRMRDEAHRFTISYHRLLRSKQARRSILDEVPSIGPKTKKRLLSHFGSLKAIRQADLAAIAALIGKAKAQMLRDYL